MLNGNDYCYGMKRFFDIGCQPTGQKGLVTPELLEEINNFIKPNIKFLDIVRYEKELSIENIEKYELKYLGTLESLQHKNSIPKLI
jgi:hypothetical protein